MTDQLSALDHMFLDLEQTDDGAHMHIGAALVFGPRGDGGIPSIDELRASVAERLPRLPRFSQRLSAPRTSQLGWLTWVPAEQLDIPAHVRHATLPAPGGEAELLEWLGDFWSHRLDRTRPLWEMTLLDGLAEGGWVLATKTHHCLVDGVGALDIGDVILDGDAVPPPQQGAPSPPPAVPEGEHRPAHQRWLSLGSLVQATRSGLERVVHPAQTAMSVAAMTELLIKEELIAAPRTSLNGPLGATRDFAVARVRLDEVKEIKNTYGGTVNDVVLALCTGGLRRLLLQRDEPLPAHGMRAQIPVNIRSSDQQHDLGNQLTSLFVDLPVHEADAMARYVHVVDATQSVKSSGQPVAGKAMVDMSNVLPPVVGSRLGRTMFGGRRLFNLTITNVPGPQLQLYGLGSPLREILPLVPLFANHYVGIAVVSYNGSLVFGIHADHAGAPDAREIVRGIEDAFAELRPSVHRPRRRFVTDTAHRTHPR